ncbi:MAG: diguanylate cyclase domain-containing protein [Wenzhouxiangella sp.]
MITYSLVAWADGCSHWLERADEIRQLREYDAARGVDEANLLIEQLMDLSAQTCPQALAQAYRARATNLTVLGQLDAALDDVEHGLMLLAEDNPDLRRYRAALQLTAGVAFWELGAHDQAIGRYLASLALSEQVGDADGIARAAGNLGNLYNTLGDFDLAREFHQRAFDGFVELGNEVGQAGTLINLAALDFRQASMVDEPEDVERWNRSALANARRSLVLFETLGNPMGIAMASNNVASAMEALGNVEQSLPYYRRSLEFRRQVGDQSGITMSLITQAGALIQLERLDEAAVLLDEAGALIAEENLGIRADYLTMSVRLARARGDSELALEQQMALTELLQRISTNQMALRVEELRLGFEAERRDQQLEILRNEATIRDLQLERQRLTTLLSLGLALGLLVLLLLMFRLYRQGRRLSGKLEAMARRDSLTGLANRRAMDERIADFMHKAAAGPARTAALLLLDADDFKRINDQYGHPMGDQVLIDLARVLETSLGKRGRIARWGGEEFLVLSPNCDQAQAIELAEALRQAVEQVAVGPPSMRVTLTVGVTLMRSDEPAHTAISRADAALYRGKSSGRNQVVFES